jgi:hypothetical protein
MTPSTALSALSARFTPGSASHCVVGFFGEADTAAASRSRLLALGLPAAQVQVFHATPLDTAEPLSGHPTEAGSDAALKDMWVDGAIGGVAGAGLGALAELALVAADVSLFVASPLLAPLVMLGWGATVGATVGAVVGVEKKAGPLSALIRDAVAHGQTVLLAQTRNDAEREQARQVIRQATDDPRPTAGTAADGPAG